jgi:hypothetical protein
MSLNLDLLTRAPIKITIAYYCLHALPDLDRTISTTNRN